MLVWLAVLIGLALKNRSVRSSLASVIRSALEWKILVVLGAMIVHVSLIVIIAYRLGLWDLSLTKDTLLWLVGPAMIMVFSAATTERGPHCFKKILFTNLHVALLIEFIASFYVFPFPVELLFVPVVFFVAATLAYSETKAEYAPAKRVLQYVMAVIGLSIVLYATANIFDDVRSFASVETLRLFLLPIGLTIVFAPFLYSLALITGYEEIFVRLGIWIPDSELARYTRRKILLACRLSLGRVNTFAIQHVVRLSTIKSRADADELLAQFRTH